MVRRHHHIGTMTGITNTHRPLKTLLAAALALSVTASGALALEIQGSGVPKLRSGNDQLTIGGVTGRGQSDPAARKCYGSTLCRESGTYYSEDGVLHYKNGDPVEDVRRPSGTRDVPGANPSR